MVYSPPPNLEIAGFPRRWGALLIGDINNCHIRISGFHRIAYTWVDPWERAVCSNCWIPQVRKQTNEKTKASFGESRDGKMFLVLRVYYFFETHLKSNASHPRQTKIYVNYQVHQGKITPLSPHVTHFKTQSLCCSPRLPPLLFFVEMDISWSLSL